MEIQKDPDIFVDDIACGCNQTTDNHPTNMQHAQQNSQKIVIMLRQHGGLWR